jgi:hypothetical protein
MCAANGQRTPCGSNPEYEKSLLLARSAEADPGESTNGVPSRHRPISFAASSSWASAGGRSGANLGPSISRNLLNVATS